MKILKQSAAILFVLFSVFAARAEYDPTDLPLVEPEARFQIVASQIEHSSTIGTTSGCCDVDVRLKVTYTLNGQTYTTTSSASTISVGGSAVLTVAINNNAVVTDEVFYFYIGGTLVFTWSYITNTQSGQFTNGVGLCSACPSVSEILMVDAPNGANQKKHFWFDFIV